MSCDMCRDVGWILEHRPSKPEALHMVECVLPDCISSGRHITSLELPQISLELR